MGRSTIIGLSDETLVDMSWLAPTSPLALTVNLVLAFTVHCLVITCPLAVKYLIVVWASLFPGFCRQSHSSKLVLVVRSVSTILRHLPSEFTVAPPRFPSLAPAWNNKKRTPPLHSSLYEDTTSERDVR